eukprot:GILI01027328.1.p1 GENE.GILI01027328.1~~GILI01027328.1.p1  ORF type:complete len:246 (-),score=16.57 GILI01027328.1:78-815(-)
MLRRISSFSKVGFAFSLHQRRFLKYPLVLNSDSAQSVANAREMIKNLKTNGKWNTTQHLVRVMNVAIALLQDGQFYEAKEIAEGCHQMVLSSRGASHELVAFTSVTCANCCAKLAENIEEQLEEKKERSLIPDSIQAPLSKVLTNERFIQKLRDDEARYQDIAKRIVDMPENAHMKSASRRQSESTSWEDTGSSRSNNAESYNDNDRGQSDKAERFDSGWKERRARSYHHERRRQQQAGGRKVPR